MKPQSRLVILSVMATAAVSVLRAQRPPVAEDVFKNVQVLKGIPVNQFMETMGVFSASLRGSQRPLRSARCACSH